jgi:hypothetical protein
MEALLSGQPSGQLIPLTLAEALRRIAALEHRMDELEQQVKPLLQRDSPPSIS